MRHILNNGGVITIRFRRFAQLKRGKHDVKWATETTDYNNTNFPRTSLQFFRTRYGDVHTIYWMADFDDVIHMDEWRVQVGADKDYRELKRKSLDMLVEGSVIDTVTRSVL